MGFLNNPPRRVCRRATDLAENARRSPTGATRRPHEGGPTCRALRLPSTGWGCYSPIGCPLPFSLWRLSRGRDEGGRMPRRKTLVTAIREIVQDQVQDAIQGLLGAVGGPKKKPKNGRRSRRRGRGKWRPGGLGRPPGSKTRKRRGPGRPRKTEQTAPKVGTRRKRRGPGRPPKKAKAE